MPGVVHDAHLAEELLEVGRGEPARGLRQEEGLLLADAVPAHGDLQELVELDRPGAVVVDAPTDLDDELRGQRHPQARASPAEALDVQAPAAGCVGLGEGHRGLLQEHEHREERREAHLQAPVPKSKHQLLAGLLLEEPRNPHRRCQEAPNGLDGSLEALQDGMQLLQVYRCAPRSRNSPQLHVAVALKFHLHELIELQGAVFVGVERLPKPSHDARFHLHARHEERHKEFVAIDAAIMVRINLLELTFEHAQICRQLAELLSVQARAIAESSAKPATCRHVKRAWK
mmetsp:Transcript_6278/g.18018  ORF Transcript_6278/g.18018 Transcript_6278/m.18018 type:complete len:287 (+) Transcript_6278:471-1331(+)